MSIQAYKKEIEDGLKEQLSNNTIAFNCSLTKSDVPTDTTLKTVAAFKDGRNFDLYYLQSILASVGPNKNDDWFLPEEIWAAKETPVHKQLNYMHNEKDIIGVITDSIVLDVQGNTILTESFVPNIKDIATQAVIWTHWDDKSVENRISKIIASIEENKYFVSMEALFKKFDYMLVTADTITLVPRSESTAFLTKHLRAYGGSGEFENARVYRVLREFTFSGKGIVEDPANPRSIINDSLFHSEASCDCGCECCDSPEEEVELDDYEEVDEDFSAIASEQKDKKVKLNKPFRTPKGPKKFSVYVKNDKGNIVKVNFGDPNMEIKRDDPKRREAFRSRHNCDNPGPKWKAKYWSCKFWSTQNVNKIVSTTSENIMEKEVAQLQNELAKANEKISELTKALEINKVSAEVSNLQDQIKALKALAEDSQKKMDETEKECAEKMDKMEKDCAEKMDKMEKDCASKVEALEASLATLKNEKIVAERKSKLIAARVSEDVIDNVLKTFASASDEMFAEIANLYAKSQSTTESTSASLADAVESAQANSVSQNVVEKVEASTANEDRIQLLQKSLAEKIKFTNKKGDK